MLLGKLLLLILLLGRLLLLLTLINWRLLLLGGHGGVGWKDINFKIVIITLDWIYSSVNIPIIPIGYSRLSKYILPLTGYSNPNLTSSPIDPHKLNQFLIIMSIDQQN
jgi:hypothetical protein